MKKLKKYLKGFTLVELIIVITILVILATIAFISFKGYTLNARDGNRIATIKNIEKGLTLFKVKSGNYPIPDEKVNIEASGSIISYQGKVGEGVSIAINMNTNPRNPIDKTKYIYSTNKNQNKYQLLAYMERDDYITFFPQTYAQNLPKRYPQVFGDNVGIILKEDNSFPTETKIETHTGSIKYKIFFKENDTIVSSGNTIFSNIYNRRIDLINNKDIAKLDQSLVGYWDMDTLTQSGDTKYWLKDLSSYGNNGACYNNGSYVSCNGFQSGSHIVDGNGTTGKAMSFDGIDDQVTINHNLNFSGSVSVFLKFKANTYGNCKKNYRTISDYSVNIISAMKGNNDYQGPFWVEFRCNGMLDFYIKKEIGALLALFGRTTDYDISNFLYYLGRYNKETGKGGLYLNGDFKNSWDTTTTPNTSLYTGNNKIILGSGRNTSGVHNFGQYYDGLIDEVRIYNRALSDSEIKELYNATK